ncbi:hypothetical protein [Actinoplanes aureus]|uniref:Uncharacterized protein n=1 Tax=Actinoplanes aureus TaxID=2792083 RepID=A0A931CFX9_9ACTN|nr:hypothetical protein [Actinoplanes aureus]MBG0565383.1 hypothetical protein [Actinoplanes aureus]
MTGIADPERMTTLLGALEEYRTARSTLLESLGLPQSNRDPLAGFSEALVQTLLGGTLAANPVQADYDLILPDGAKVQVRYLANGAGPWVNEHRVYVIDDVPYYALVIFEAFRVAGVLVFPTARLAVIGAALGKKHPRTDEQLQLTRRTWQTIRDDTAQFHGLGMRIWLRDPSQRLLVGTGNPASTPAATDADRDPTAPSGI